MQTMKRIPTTLAVAASLIWVPLAMGVSAPAQTAEQESVQSAAAVAPVIPQQVRYSGKLATRTGDTVEAQFSIYAAPEGGDPLWTETQKVMVDADGAYTVLLGSASNAGVPQTLFQGGAARWLGVSVERAPELERVLLSSVPYAMKSADAQALAGHPAGDFVTQGQLSEQFSQFEEQHAPPQEAQPLLSGTITGSGTTGAIPEFTGANTIGNSEIVQVGSDIGINEATPAATLDVNGTTNLRGTLSLPPLATATTSTGHSSNITEWSTSVWSSTANAAVTPVFRLNATPVGNNTANPSGSLYLQYQLGSTQSYIFNIAGNGTMTTYGGLTSVPSNLATSSAAVNSPLFEQGASVYSSSSSSAVEQKFAWQVIPTGNNTSTPSANFALLYTTGSNIPTPTGLSISPTGSINFAPGQTFPGTGSGTITGITTTSPLTGSGTSGSVALGLNTSTLETTLNGVYPQLSTSNTFASGASFAGPLSASASGSGLNAVTATGTTGAYGISASSDTGNAGSFGNASAPDATIYSLNTASFDGSYIPVALNATGSGTSSVGAYGDGTLAGVFGLASTGLGVWGASGSISSLPTVTNTGVLGQGTTGVMGQGSQTGMLGVAATPDSGDAGVLGYTSASQSGSYAYEVARDGIAGVWGDTTGNPASVDDFSAGVMGTTDAYDGYGGVFISNSNVTDALFAKNLNSGDGIYGESLGTGVSSGKGTGGTGVEGFTPSPAEGAAGVLGNAYQLSNTYSTVEALGPVGLVAGVWGDSGEVNDGTGTYTAGVVGTGDDITAGIFENNSQHPTLSVTNLDSSGGGTGLSSETLFKTLMASTPDGTCGFGSGGNLTCTGQIKSLATTGDARTVETYSMQSPENWMEDFGSGELRNGVAVIKIDADFAETVTADSSYHVFITPNGDSAGLYVINKTANSFEVRESKGGTSSLTFDYRIVGKRRGFEAQRLTDVTERFNTERARAMPTSKAEVFRTPMQTRPAITSPGMPVAPGIQKAPHELPRNHSVPLKVGAGRLQTVNHPSDIHPLNVH